MNYWTIAVVGSPGLEDWARMVAWRLETAWNILPRARFETVEVERLEAPVADAFDAVVLVAGAREKNTRLVRPLTMLEEQHVPVMALLDCAPEPGGVFEHAAVLVEDRATSGAILCARLHGMLHRQREVNELRHEIAVAGLSHGGLGEEVAKMHEELQLAAQAQRELLPGELPSLHGVSVAAMWRPAQYVSGDIYDVARLDDDHVGLFLADAVGHGVSAALMTMVIAQSLVTRVIDGDAWRILPPSAVLAGLNAKLIGRTMQPSRFATAVYAVINCRARRMTLATAGHPPPFLVRRDGSFEALHTSGGLLGIFADLPFDEREVDLAEGDSLMFYTDGFEQAFPAAQDPTLRRPTAVYREELLRLARAGDPQRMIEEIARRLDVQSGSLHQVDDLTLLCVHAGRPAVSEPLTAAEKMAA
jgi:sigma-B regulation protein RsbU (phosphoserine phosphatase)